MELNALPTERKIILCPYCGHVNPGPAERCGSCGGFFDPLSRRVTQQHMGPWFIRDSANPFRPGCTYEVMAKQVQRGKVTANTILRGPTTKQFWSVARHVPGIAHLLGTCHQCSQRVQPTDPKCPKCGAKFGAVTDRQHLGVDPEDPGVWDEVEKTRAEEAAMLEAEKSGKPAESKPAEHPSMFAPASGGIDKTTEVPHHQHETPAAKARVISQSSTDDDDDLYIPGAESQPASPPPPSEPEPVQQQAPSQPQPQHAAAHADAMDWMTGQNASDNTIESMGDYDRSERSSNLMVWVLVGMNLLLAAVVTFIILSRDPDSETPPPDETPAAAPSEPSDTSSRTDSNGSASVASANNVRTWEDDEPDAPATATPPTKPSPAAGPELRRGERSEASDQPRANQPTANTPPRPNTNNTPQNVVSFFGIEIKQEAGATLTHEQAEDFNNRMDNAIKAKNEGRYAESLNILKSIKRELPEGVTADGLGESIAAMEEQVRRAELENFLGE